MFDLRKSPETNPRFIYGFVYIHINAFGINTNIGVCWKSSMIGFRSFFNRGSRSSQLNQSSQSASIRVSSVQVRHSKGMWNFIGHQLSFCKHVLFVSSGVKHVHEINVHTCTLISSHLCHLMHVLSPIERDTLYLKPSFKV